MLNMDDIESVAAELKKWKETVGSKINLNYHYIAEELGCSYSYVCRLAKGQRPSYDLASELLKLIRPDTPEAVWAFLKREYPDKHRPVEPEPENKEKVFKPEQGASYFEDEFLYRVYRLSEPGVFTRDDIALFLSSGLTNEAIDFLIENEVVEELDGKISRCKEQSNTYNFGTMNVVTCFRYNLDIIEKKWRRGRIDANYEFDSDSNSLCGLNYSVTPEAFAELAENRRRYLKKQQKLMHKSSGRIPVFLNDTLGRYDDK